MEMALGSAYELETQTLVLQRREWCPNDGVTELLQAIEEQQRMLIGFMGKPKP